MTFQIGDDVKINIQMGIRKVLYGPIVLNDTGVPLYLLEGHTRDHKPYLAYETDITLAPIIWTAKVKAQLDAWMEEAVATDKHTWRDNYQYLTKQINGIKVAEIERGSEA